MWLFSRSGVSFLAHRSETLPNLFSNFLDPSQSLIKNIACGNPRPQTLRPIATESIGRSVRRGPKMKKQEDARLAVLREYDKWAKDHPTDAKKMGGYVFFGYLEKERPDLLDFRATSKWQIVHLWLRHGGRLKD